MIRIHEALIPLLVPIESIQRHPENAWQGDVEAIVESMEANGVYRPVIVQSSTRYAIAGNHTWEALLSQGQPHVPVLPIDCDDQTARRILLADNRTAQRGRYDDGDLLALLQSVGDNDFRGLVGTGWESDEVLRLTLAVGQPFRGSEFGGSPGPHCWNCGVHLGGPR